MKNEYVPVPTTISPPPKPEPNGKLKTGGTYLLKLPPKLIASLKLYLSLELKIPNPYRS